RQEVNEVMETGILFRYNHDAERKGIWKAATFEKEFAAYHGVKHAQLCTSGSTAVSIALASCGIGAGDEVIVPPFTYIATVEAVLLAGAVPVFSEVDETLCLSVEGIKKSITPNTKAVVVVHMCGAMAMIKQIKEVCDQHNIILIEDTAQALAASLDGKMAGTFGEVGSFSFDFFKIITAGEGGAVITNSSEKYDVMHQWADHGHDHIGDNRGAEQHPILGFNFRISELHAAVGLAQFRKIDSILKIQRNNKKVLKAALAEFPEISFRNQPDENGDSATFLSFLLPDAPTALRISNEMANAGVGGAYWYNNNFHFIKNWQHLKDLKSPGKLPVSLFKHQDYNNLDLGKTNDVISRLISFQVKVGWTETQLNEVRDKLYGVFKSFM
ncbi:MAG: DegT/DnrJ/EryC1/StrS family aminotransferase, partial [Bacteroidales bacterium]|nr:DegT/DnrJ/EryC1/StrS family aminotransferase [Bacteroidales bacterium]